MAVLQLVAGIGILTIGAELLIRYAVKLSLAARISPLIIGLTVVAFATSAPELVISLQSAWRGQPDLALGNVIGSNTFNILVILGLSALITPLVVDRKLIRFDVPLLIVASFLLWGLARDRLIGRGDGLLLVAGLVVFMVWSIRSSRQASDSSSDEFAREYEAEATKPTLLAMLRWLVMLVVGLGLLVFGARLFTGAAVDIARRLGVSELVIGLTIVSAGTSLPEVATSVMAAWKGERDIAVGNAVGSSLFNILCVLGLTAVIAPEGVRVAPAALHLDLPVMVAASLACLPIFFTAHRIDRWEGGLFLACYGAYIAALFLIATDSPHLMTYQLAMLGFVLPLTAVTLAVLGFRAWQQHQTTSEETST